MKPLDAPLGSQLRDFKDTQSAFDVIRETFFESETVQAFDARARLEKLDPLLALAYRVEASGDRRADARVSADSLLTGLRDAARRALKAAGHPERAPDELYPSGRRI